MAEINVTFQALRDTATEIRKCNTNLDKDLTDISTEMSRLKGKWESDSAETIRAAMDAMKPRFSEYKEVVETYAKFLDDTAQTYEETESTLKTNASQFIESK